MAARRKAVKVRSTGPGLRERLAGVGRVLWRPMALWVLPTVALTALCVVGLAWARQEVAASPKYRVVAPVLAGVDDNGWDPSFTKEINRCVAFANGASIMDETLPEQVAAAYHACPWVKRVLSVEKRYPGQLVARIDLRRPVAAVAFKSTLGTRYYLVGDDGVRLPRSYTEWKDARRFGGLLISGVASVPPPAGQMWNERSVLDAIRVVKLLAENTTIARQFKRFDAVDVSNYGGRRDRSRSELNIHASDQCIIEWGRPPDSDAPGELSVEQKIQKLERFIREQNPTANRTLDVRFAGPVVVSRRYGRNGSSY